ncbi:hypothetical protein [Pseudarthrobacter sp. lyk4-40-TYG-27]|uniref:hypothetical protein n=1 Tax=Pseudarthrobacter sp. lyk4-40-TYG-27 TaxID=3040305 RepID=UPI0025579310|nr:hypothetical protein [Pseudarthrobacter sp. lyk4-40-TYG-27]
MNTAKSLSVLSAGAMLALTSVVVGPAGPSEAADTTTTFTVSGGALGISVPVSKDLGSGAAAGTLSAQLGAVTVTDNRAQLGASWTAQASSTGFTNTTVTAADPITSATYASGVATATTGIAAFVPGQLANALPAPLGATGITAFSASATTGNNSATWNPTVVVTIPAQAIQGRYQGVITHSVS